MGFTGFVGFSLISGKILRLSSDVDGFWAPLAGGKIDTDDTLSISEMPISEKEFLKWQEQCSLEDGFI